jgi:hypothetical protein
MARLMNTSTSQRWVGVGRGRTLVDVELMQNPWGDAARFQVTADARAGL